MAKRTKEEKDERKRRRRNRASEYDFGCGPWALVLELFILMIEFVSC